MTDRSYKVNYQDAGSQIRSGVRRSEQRRLLEISFFFLKKSALECVHPHLCPLTVLPKPSYSVVIHYL
jgi:hypothetical protein